ncbi:lipocalin family protein [Pandoraea pulmonicola]|uniref:Outer membrane lipoprotein Blc n=1 Tax=Pandoraea pulmonicola TaxID=93221 RepID=A0AAJ4ZCY6_PANPU|nr:lipocalin family protein [Pandoraea pulmonicola]AJC20463.1 lipocalin [Pandoraea pulmonicola]SUA91127.1 Outer membrane lipoprotein blc precursor [Pandoraea pulmonicola]
MNKVTRWVGAAMLGLSVVAAVAWAQSGQESLTTRVRPVQKIDKERYVGTWYEIARYPNFFERKCVSDVTAEYVALSDGKIAVTNKCRKEDGTWVSDGGLARTDGQGTGTARFKVTFAPDWLRWIPWLWANYWVIVLDGDYQHAAVGEPGREYLWILSRTPTMDENALNQMRAQLRKQGYDTDKLVLTPQKASVP